jgi:hypothetical protein
MANEQGKSEHADLRTVKALLKLLEEHKLDVLEVGNIKLVKSKHIIEIPVVKPNKKIVEPHDPVYSSKEEEELFNWSSS